MGKGDGREGVPTALSSMMDWALVFAADMVAGLAWEPKRRRRKEMVGDGIGGFRDVCGMGRRLLMGLFEMELRVMKLNGYVLAASGGRDHDKDDAISGINAWHW